MGVWDNTGINLVLVACERHGDDNVDAGAPTWRMSDLKPAVEHFRAFVHSLQPEMTRECFVGIESNSIIAYFQNDAAIGPAIQG